MAALAFPLPARQRSLKARLRAGEKLYGGFLCTLAPYLAEMMGLVGYDYVVVDLEHGPGETDSALHCVRALEAVGTPAIIRVGFNDQVLLKKALDLGPSGVIVPMVQNAQKAAYAVSCCRYPPAGIRGANPFVRAARFGLDKSYLSGYENDLLLICQIESAEAVDLIPEIAAVDGVDGLMIGPRDLSASVGCLSDPGNPCLAALIAKAEQAVLDSPRKVFLKGLARPEIDPPPALYDRGYHIVSGIIDAALFTTAALADIKAHKPLPSSDSVTSNGSRHSNGPHSSAHVSGILLDRPMPDDAVNRVQARGFLHLCCPHKVKYHASNEWFNQLHVHKWSAGRSVSKQVMSFMAWSNGCARVSNKFV